MVIYLCVGPTTGTVTLHIQSAYEGRFLITVKLTKLCYGKTVVAGIAMSL
jgi:hypothetical protein